MVENNFVFTDLSTYNLRVAKDFYANVFSWNYIESDNNYFTAQYKKKEVSGLYEMPQKFKDLNMPSFWMSYIRVENLTETVEKARGLGGVVELVDSNQTVGKIALIRDPLGAGFTIYEGNLLNSRFENQQNTLVWNELFISDFSKIKPFYEGIFQWVLQRVETNRYLIENTKNKVIGAIQEISNIIKGEKEYWGVFFAVNNVSESKAIILKNGGKLLYDDTDITVLADSLGAFFHIVPIKR